MVRQKNPKKIDRKIWFNAFQLFSNFVQFFLYFLRKLKQRSLIAAINRNKPGKALRNFMQLMRDESVIGVCQIKNCGVELRKFGGLLAAKLARPRNKALP